MSRTKVVQVYFPKSIRMEKPSGTSPGNYPLSSYMHIREFISTYTWIYLHSKISPLYFRTGLRFEI